MANLLDYLAWRGDLPLSAVPLCDVDALIFARLSYVPFDGIAESRVPLYMAARQVLASVQLSDAPRACGKEEKEKQFQPTDRGKRREISFQKKIAQQPELTADHKKEADDSDTSAGGLCVGNRCFHRKSPFISKKIKSILNLV